MPKNLLLKTWKCIVFYLDSSLNNDCCMLAYNIIGFKKSFQYPVFLQFHYCFILCFNVL